MNNLQAPATSASSSTSSSSFTSRNTSREDLTSSATSSTSYSSTPAREDDKRPTRAFYAQQALISSADPELGTVTYTGEMKASRYPEPPLNGRILNFGVVQPGVYRSSYPLIDNFPFCDSLGLKTIVSLVNKDDERKVNLGQFVEQRGIRHIVFEMKGTKKEDIPSATMASILAVILDKAHYPLLMHCNQGKHRTGCVVAAARKVSGWTAARALDEYKEYAEPKARDCDLKYIEAFTVESLGQLTRRKSEAHAAAPVALSGLGLAVIFVFTWFFVAMMLNVLVGETPKHDNFLENSAWQRQKATDQKHN